MLSIRKLSAGYGPIAVVRAIDMDVAAGECVALIGWSGSGKTTVMKTVAGLLPASSGEIVYEGQDIALLPAHLRVPMGMAMVPEGRHLFAGMTAYENVLVGAHTVHNDTSVAERTDFIFELFPILKERRNQIAGTLSGGEQQMCAIARALMSKPRLLLIDELSLGLAPVVVARLVEALKTIRKLGATIIVVEQDAALALAISDRAYVIQGGQIKVAGASAVLQSNPMVRQDYIGQSRSA